MNKAKQLTEAIEELLEYNPFGPMGFNIKKHIYLSPDDKKKLLKKRKRVGDIVKTQVKERKRITSVYKHEDEHFGHIEHKTLDNHPVDSNWYSLEKQSKNENNFLEAEMLSSEYPKHLKDRYAIADHIENTSPQYVDNDLVADNFTGKKAELKHTPVNEIREGHPDINIKSKYKKAKYKKIDSSTRPPIVVEKGEIQDGNHRYRDAVAKGESHIWAYHVTDK